MALALCLQHAQAQTGKSASSVLPVEPSSGLATASHDAQRAYQGARDKLVQIRTLLRNTNTQSSLGSGFFVFKDGLIITNFHAVSQLALEPDRYRGVYVPVNGKQAEVQLLAFDVQHDLALLRVTEPLPVQEALSFRRKDAALVQGERLYSMGQVAEKPRQTRVSSILFGISCVCGAAVPGLSCRSFTV